MSTNIVSTFEEQLKNKDLTISTAAILSFAAYVDSINPTTISELNHLLDEAKSELLDHAKNVLGWDNSISLVSLRSGCEIFIRNITRGVNDGNINECLKNVKARSESFSRLSLNNRSDIARKGKLYIRDGMTILTHGVSRVVHELFANCKDYKRLHILVTAGGLERDGVRVANDLQRMGIHTTLIPDSGVGYFMHTVNLVVLGAEAVAETGGIFNKLGSFQIGVMAKSFNIPVYVATEAYKFTRMYPLSQKNVPNSVKDQELIKRVRPAELDAAVEFASVRCDYLPPEYITFLITDLGVLTPYSVSDELTKLYNSCVCC